MTAEASLKQAAVGAMARGGLFKLMFDARQPGVCVPAKFAHDSTLVLTFSNRFSPDDLTVNEWGARQTLSFGGMLFRCAVPWQAVYVAVSETLDYHLSWSLPDEPPTAVLPPFKGLRLVK